MASDRKTSLQSLDASFLDAIHGRVEPQFIQHPVPEPGGEKGASVRQAAEPEKAAENPLDALKVTVSEDGMEARLGAVRRLTAPVTADALLGLLKEEGVDFGIDQAAIAQVVAASRLSQGWGGEIVVARGREPAKATVDYLFLQSFEGDTKDLAGDLSKRFQAETLDALWEGGPKAMAVAQGEPLAVLPEKGSSQPGQDVFGLLRHDSWENELRLGDHVVLNETGVYAARIYGYLQFRNNRLEIVPPVWIAPDKMQAYFISLPQLGPPKFPTPEALGEVLAIMGVKPELILNEAIKQLCAGLMAPQAVKIAEGQAPRHGRDAEIDLFFDPGGKAGAIRADDTIDLRERNLVINTEAGQLLARKRPAGKGTPGMNLLGEKMEARNGQDLPLEARQGVAVEQRDGVFSYTARTAGVVMYMGRSLAVTEMYHVDSDVDYATGNLEVAGDLHLAGTIRSGFSVKCGGNAILEGMIEAGATVFVKGDLIVRQGILGETTKVVVHGDLRTMFIQDAEVIVRGDLWVGSHVYNASVRSTGSLFIQRGIGTRGGRVVGGILCAADGVQVSALGSSGNRSTLVALQSDPQAMVQVNKLGYTVRAITNQVARMLRTLGLDSLDAEALRVLLASIPPNRRKKYVELLTQLNLSLKQKRRLQKKRKMLQEEMETRLQRAVIQVTREVYQGNRVQIGSSAYVAERDMGPTTFRLQDDRIVF